MEYIERAAVIEFGEQQLKRLDDGEAYRRLDAWLNTIPAADVRPVVLCKDCRHRDPEDHKCDCGQLERAGCVFPVDDDYFCAYGER